jgi:hypothetical protein
MFQSQMAKHRPQVEKLRNAREEYTHTKSSTAV